MACPECQIFKEHFLVLREGYEKQKLELESERRGKQEARLEVDRLQSILDENNDALKQVEHDRDSIAAQYNILKENSERIEDHMKANRMKGTELSKIRNDSEKSIHAMEAELRAQTARVRDLTDRCNTLQREASDGDSKHTQSHTESASLRERCNGYVNEIQRLEQAVDELQSDVVRKTGEIHKLQTELEDQHSELEFFKEEQTAELERENKRRDKALQDRTLQNAELMRERESLATSHTASEASWRHQMQTEREDYQMRIAELNERTNAVQEEASRAATDFQQRIVTMRSDAKALQLDNNTLREQRRELEEQRADLTAKATRLERAEAYARQEGRLVMENGSKARQELDRAKLRITETKDIEAKAALLEVRLQYKEQELQEARQDKEAMHLERGKIMVSLQKIVDKEQKKLKRCKREQTQLLLALNEAEVQRGSIEQKYIDIARDFESFKRNIDIRDQAAAALQSTPTRNEAAFVPDQDVFKSLAENFQKTAELEKRNAA